MGMHARTHTEKKNKGVGKRGTEKRGSWGRIKACLSFASTFHLWRGLTKGSWLALLARSPGNLGSGPKTKITGKTGKTTPPSKQLGNHCSLKGRGGQPVLLSGPILHRYTFFPTQCMEVRGHSASEPIPWLHTNGLDLPHLAFNTCLHSQKGLTHTR